MKRYKRPTVLSDPYFDFTEEVLKAILAKSDEELGLYEYMCIFGEFLPAGMYEECAYFIRPLLDYLDRLGDRACNEPDAADHFFGWAKKNRARLEADGLYREPVDYFAAMLRRLLATAEPRQNADGWWYLSGCDMAQSIIVGLNAAADGMGDAILREAMQGEDLAPHLCLCYFVWWHREIPSVIEHGSPLLDELVQHPIVTSRSGRIVDGYVLKSDDQNLWAFWAKYGKG